MPINWVCCYCYCSCYFVIVSNWLQFPIGFGVYRISICSISTHVLRQVLSTSFRHIFLLVTWSYTVDSPKLWFVGYCFYWPAWKGKSRTQGKKWVNGSRLRMEIMFSINIYGRIIELSHIFYIFELYDIYKSILLVKLLKSIWFGCKWWLTLLFYIFKMDRSIESFA